jgi:replication-associated recombination protein RarA
MLPSAYKPKTPADFIGPAQKVADLINKLLAATLSVGSPLKLLLLGCPGIGKTELANYFMARLCCDRWHTTVLNGTQVKIEAVEELAASLRYKELFGQYRLIRIEEVDKVPVVAQVRLLTLLDDLPNHAAVLCTSNCTVNDLEERFQSRFLLFDLAPPTGEQIEELLKKLAAPLSALVIKQIATFACGNVRQALLDADSALLSQLDWNAA